MALPATPFQASTSRPVRKYISTVWSHYSWYLLTAALGNSYRSSAFPFLALLLPWDPDSMQPQFIPVPPFPILSFSLCCITHSLSLVYTHQLSYNVLLPKVALLAVLLIFQMLKTVSMWVEQCWCDNEWRKWPPYSGAQRTVLNYCVSIRKHIELCSLMGTVRVWFLRTWV